VLCMVSISCHCMWMLIQKKISDALLSHLNYLMPIPTNVNCGELIVASVRHYSSI
jgi:hypothetical protein